MADLAPAGPDRTHRTILIAAAIAATALWTTLATAQLHPAAADVVKVLAGFTTGVALLLPWCRRAAHRSVQAVAEVADLQLDAARQSASSHAARWRAIVDTATEGIVTIDERGTIEEVNGAAERLFGFGSGELTGKNVSVLMPSPHQEMHDEYLRAYLKTGERRIIGIGREVLGRHKNGTEFPIDLSVGEGTSQGQRFFAAVIRDLTERKEMQMKLAQTERLAAVGELAAGIAHEVNNPINTIINCAQLILDDDEKDENSRIIIEEGQRIAEIVRDLLRFARDDRDTPQPTSIPEVVQRTLRLVGENLKRHGVGLVVTVPDDLVQVLARPQQIQQVLLNLVINAKDALIHFQREGRRIEIAARGVDGGVELTVQDNGPGIPEHLGSRIFEPFVTTKRARGGTGLGLSISKSIVEGYNGTIGVTSVPGEGATFRIWLPQVCGDS